MRGDLILQKAVILARLSEYVVFCVFSGAYEWAQKTLKDHAKDKREYLYTREQFEKAQTHDKLWNAAQVQQPSEAEGKIISGGVFSGGFLQTIMLFCIDISLCLKPLTVFI